MKACPINHSSPACFINLLKGSLWNSRSCNLSHGDASRTILLIPAYGPITCPCLPHSSLSLRSGEGIRMSVPLSQMWTVASYVLKQKLKGNQHYPLVLMLE